MAVEGRRWMDPPVPAPPAATLLPRELCALLRAVPALTTRPRCASVVERCCIASAGTSSSSSSSWEARLTQPTARGGACDAAAVTSMRAPCGSGWTAAEVITGLAAHAVLRGFPVRVDVASASSVGATWRLDTDGAFGTRAIAGPHVAPTLDTATGVVSGAVRVVALLNVPGLDATAEDAAAPRDAAAGDATRGGAAAAAAATVPIVIAVAACVRGQLLRHPTGGRARVAAWRAAAAVVRRLDWGFLRVRRWSDLLCADAAARATAAGLPVFVARIAHVDAVAAGGGGGGGGAARSVVLLCDVDEGPEGPSWAWLAAPAPAVHPGAAPRGRARTGGGEPPPALISCAGAAVLRLAADNSDAFGAMTRPTTAGAAGVCAIARARIPTIAAAWGRVVASSRCTQFRAAACRVLGVAVADEVDEAAVVRAVERVLALRFASSSS